MSAGKRTPEMAARLVETGLNRLIRATIKILPFKEAQKTQFRGRRFAEPKGKWRKVTGRVPLPAEANHFDRSQKFLQ